MARKVHVIVCRIHIKTRYLLIAAIAQLADAGPLRNISPIASRNSALELPSKLVASEIAILCTILSRQYRGAKKITKNSAETGRRVLELVSCSSLRQINVFQLCDAVTRAQKDEGLRDQPIKRTSG